MQSKPLCDVKKLFDYSKSENFRKKNNTNPTDIYLFNLINRNARKMCEISSKLSIKTPERSQ